MIVSYELLHDKLAVIYSCRGILYITALFHEHIISKMTIDHCLGLAPSYICELVEIKQPTRELRSSRQCLLQIPKTRPKTYGDASFSVYGPTQWNNLPEHIRSSTTVSKFKTFLKTHLFNTAYSDM